MNGFPLNWITTNWRLKLLSLLLSLGLVGAVAFAGNPPVFDTASVRVQYLNLPQDLVLMNPPTSIDVPVAGLRDAVTKYKATAAGVSVDLSNAKPGPNQTFAVTPRIDVPGVTARTSVSSIRLKIERLSTRLLDIEVRTKPAPGVSVISDKTYATCGNANDHCQVSVTAAASIVDSLKAYVDYDVPLTSANPVITPNEPIKFEWNGNQIDLNKEFKTLPGPSWTPSAVTVQVATHVGTETRTVGLGVHITGAPACGYSITGVDVQPNLVANITGPIEAVSKIAALPLDPIDITGLTSSTTVPRKVLAPSNQITTDLTLVRVTVGIAQSFNCAASTPAPAALAQPTPSPPR